MCVNIFPQTKLRLPVQIDHFLNVHDIGVDQIDHIAVRNSILRVIDGHHRIILIPSPVFFPRQIVAEQTAVCFLRKAGMQLHKLSVIPLYTSHISGFFVFAGDLRVLDHISHFVGDDLPSKPPVQRYRIRVKQGKGFMCFPHPGQSMNHQSFHNPMPCILRVGADTGHKPDTVPYPENIHIQRIYRKL